MVENSWPSNLTLKLMVFSISFHVLIHPNKMEEQRGKFAILLKPVSLLWLKVSYPPNIGHMLFKQQCILLIFYQPNFSIFSLPFKPFFINFPTIIISESSVACVSHPYVLIHNINSVIAQLLVSFLDMHQLIKVTYVLMSPLVVSTFPEM